LDMGTDCSLKMTNYLRHQVAWQPVAGRSQAVMTTA
jgi:hypothetical protein